MTEPARVVLGLEGGHLAEEVMHFLDRTGRARVVATAADERQLQEAVRQLEPDAVVASPSLAGVVGSGNGSVLLAVDTSESVQSLRSAIRAGARGFFLWPADREELAEAAARILPPPASAGGKRAFVVAVYGARGGVGATFLATHLASAFRRQDADCVLVDLDLGFADVTAALGVPSEPEIRTIVDALPLVGELSARHLDELLWPHPDGFRVFLAPNDLAAAQRVDASDYRAAIEAVRATADVVVLHVPRALDDVARAGLELADLILVVLALDVLSFKDAKRALATLASAGVEGRCGFVVNRAARAEITPKDVERVFGRPPVAVLPADRGVGTAQDRGRLLQRRGRTRRSLDRLAKRLLEARA
ncbi:MAG: AAA family ATPase [Actinomycetota bacterium]